MASVMQHIRNSHGFTLLEMLFVLSMIAFILTFTIPFMGHLTETHKENLFIKTFQYDLLYIQSLASLTEEQVKIHFEEDVYKIYRGNRNALLFAREIPDHIEIDMGMRKNISFDRNGRIQNANHGGIKMITKDSNYNVIFPLGKGRASIVKQ